jgi:CRISPR-associated protein Csb1
MAIDLAALNNSHRLLFAIPLKPLLGHRFQPTGFPGLGASTFRTSEGDSLLVESAQSMANRLEMMVWDEAEQDVKQALRGLSHVRIERSDGSFLTDTILESHRLNSPYLLAESSKRILSQIERGSGRHRNAGPIDRRKLARVLLQFRCRLPSTWRIPRPAGIGGWTLARLAQFLRFHRGRWRTDRRVRRSQERSCQSSRRYQSRFRKRPFRAR